MSRTKWTVELKFYKDFYAESVPCYSSDRYLVKDKKHSLRPNKYRKLQKEEKAESHTNVVDEHNFRAERNKYPKTLQQLAFKQVYRSRNNLKNKGNLTDFEEDLLHNITQQHRARINKSNSSISEQVQNGPYSKRIIQTPENKHISIKDSKNKKAKLV